jgi:hypothetical protein
MNCWQCRRQLLEENLTAEVETHLAGCPACRQWHKLLLQIDSTVPLLPVPEPTRAWQLPDELPAPLPFPEPAPRPVIRIPWRRLAFGAGGLAAAGVLIACGIFLGNMLSPPAKNQLGPVVKKGEEEKTLAGKLLELDMKLAQTDSPRQRVETLAKLAQNLEGESRSLAQVAAPKDLHSLAKLYSKVVEEGLVQRARKLPAKERRQVLDPILSQLMVAKKEAEEMMQKAPPEKAAPFQVIAVAAGNTNLQLRKLMEETP